MVGECLESASKLLGVCMLCCHWRWFSINKPNRFRANEEDRRTCVCFPFLAIACALPKLDSRFRPMKECVDSSAFHVPPILQSTCMCLAMATARRKPHLQCTCRLSLALETANSILTLLCTASAHPKERAEHQQLAPLGSITRKYYAWQNYCPP